MDRLSEPKFQRARAFVEEQARPVDRALFRYWFEKGPAEDLHRELAAFQNPDGGFFGLEPDLRLPQSSPMATSIAFQYWDWVGPEPARRDRALQYLRSTYDEKRHGWAPVSSESNRYPHAPWWEVAETGPEAGSPANPTAELLAAFLKVGKPEPWVADSLRHVLAYLDGLPEAMPMHDLLCFLHLYPRLAAADSASVRARLIAAGKAIVTRDPEAWTSYSVKPLWLAPSPDSLLARDLREELERNLDWEIAAQAADGSWEPFWAWGDSDPAGWREAQREWKGFLTVRVLKQLRDYGRLED